MAVSAAEGERLRKRYGPWALVTGASSGIGEEFAKQLAGAGLHLVLVARRRERLERLASELAEATGVDARVVCVDLADADAIEDLRAATTDLEIGLLINNAGAASSGPFLDQDCEQELGFLALNCRAPLGLSHAYGTAMRSRGRGGIVFVSSFSAFMPTPWMSHYAATKGYELLLAEGLHEELRAEGVDVLALCPGETGTEFAAKAGIRHVMDMRVEKVVRIALAKLGRRAVVIPGLHNRLMIGAARLAPRSLVRWVARLGVQSKRRAG